MSGLVRLRSNLRFLRLIDGRTALACGEEPLLIFPEEYLSIIDDFVERLNSTLTKDELLDGYEPRQVFRLRELLAFLIEEGAVVIDDGYPSSSSHAFLDTAIGSRGNSKTEVALLGSGEITDAVRDLLSHSGYRQRESSVSDLSGSLAFCDCNSVGVQEAKRLNTKALQIGMSVLYTYRPTLYEAIVGPLVVPGVTPCLECFFGRWNSNSSQVPSADSERRGDSFNLRSPPALTLSTASLSVLELMKHLEHFTVPSTWHGVLISNHRLGETSRHNILRLPNCQSCKSITPRHLPVVENENYVTAAG